MPRLRALSHPHGSVIARGLLAVVEPALQKSYPPFTFSGFLGARMCTSYVASKEASWASQRRLWAWAAIGSCGRARPSLDRLAVGWLAVGWLAVGWLAVGWLAAGSLAVRVGSRFVACAADV